MLYNKKIQSASFIFKSLYSYVKHSGQYTNQKRETAYENRCMSKARFLR